MSLDLMHFRFSSCHLNFQTSSDDQNYWNFFRYMAISVYMCVLLENVVKSIIYNDNHLLLYCHLGNCGRVLENGHT